MKISLSVSIFALMLSLPFTAGAANARCKIIGAKEGSNLAPFVDGNILIELATGNTQITRPNSEGELFRELVNEDLVSTYAVPRTKCHMARESIVRTDGSLRAVIFGFSNCVNQNPTGYVRAEIEFDLTSDIGIYREILLLPRGNSPSNFIRFNDCRVNP